MALALRCRLRLVVADQQAKVVIALEQTEEMPGRLKRRLDLQFTAIHCPLQNLHHAIADPLWPGLIEELGQLAILPAL